MTFENPSQNQIFDILKQAKNIAVVGLSNKPDRTSYKIAEILQQHGYRVLPVNPVLKGETVLGETVYGTLTEIPEKIDIVDVFRRSEFLPEVAAETLKTEAPVFGPTRLENEEAANLLLNEGRQVIMNRCIKIELAKMADAE